MTTLTFATSLPPVALSPNGRPSKWVRAVVVREYRDAVFYECLNARRAWERENGRRQWPVSNAVYRLDLTAYFKTARFWDDDNLVSAFKAGRDGMTDAAVWINDSRVRIGTVTMCKDADNPRLVVTVTTEEAE